MCHLFLIHRCLVLGFEAHAVCALVLGGVTFVSAYSDAIERTVIFVVAVVSALSYGALDAVVSIGVHIFFLQVKNKRAQWAENADCAR